MKTKVVESVELDKTIVSLLNGGIIKIQAKENNIIDVEDIKEIQIAKQKLIGDKEHFVLFVTPKIGTLTKEAREFSAAPEVNKNAKAKALVAANLGMRILINFFISFNKPPVLHRAFSNEIEALIWLREIK